MEKKNKICAYIYNMQRDVKQYQRCQYMSENATNLVERSSVYTYEVLDLGEKIDDGLVLSEK